MTKLYKYMSWLLVLVAFSLFSFLKITKSSLNNNIKICERKNKNRIESLFSACTLKKRKIISAIRATDIMTDHVEKKLAHTNMLVILLSDFKCGKCQEKELRRLDSLTSTLAPYGVHILGLTTKYKKGLTARQKKIAKIKLPIYWINDDTFNNLSFSSEYPQILYIVDSIIISAFKPITMDDEFSENYYKHLIPMITGSL